MILLALEMSSLKSPGIETGCATVRHAPMADIFLTAQSMLVVRRAEVIVPDLSTRRRGALRASIERECSIAASCRRSSNPVLFYILRRCFVLQRLEITLPGGPMVACASRSVN